MARRLRVIQKFRQLRLPFQVLIILVLAVFVGSTVYAGLGGFTDPPPTVNLSQGLVGYWSFNGDARDSSGNSAHGTVNGATLTTDKSGAANRAYAFNGTSDYINTSPVIPTADFTYSAWIKPTANSGRMILMAPNSGGGNEFFFYLNGGNLITAINGGNLTASSVTIPNDTWTHVAVVRSGSTVTQYINGVADGGGTNGSVMDFEGCSLYIGLDIDSGCSGGLGNYFKGDIDEVRAYNRAINSAELSALQQSQESQGRIQVSDTQKGLVGWWKFDGNAKDSSSTYNHGTVVGATNAADRKGQAGKAMSFNGTSDWIDNIAQPPIKTGPNEFTVAFWMNPGNQDSFFIVPNSNGIDQYIRYDSSPQRISVVLAEAANVNQRARTSANGSVPQGAWSHIAISINGQNVKIYVNGSLNAQFTETLGIADWTGNWRVGQRGNNTYWYLGSLDDLRVYDHELSADSVKQLADSYDATVSVSDLQKQLVGYWDLNINAKDKSSYYQHGIVTGAVLAADRRSRANSAYSFNGSTDYIDLPSSTASTATSAITMSLWYKATDNTNPSGHRMMFSLESATYFSLNNGSSISPFISMRINGAQRTLESNVNTTPGAWYHVAATWGGGTIKIYVNGQLQNTSPSYAGTLNTGTALKRIGRYVNNTAGYTFNGFIDDVRIYDRELNSTEIQRLYETYK